MAANKQQHRDAPIRRVSPGAGQASNSVHTSEVMKHLIGADTKYVGPDGQTRYKVTLSIVELRSIFGLPADASMDQIVAAYETPQGAAAWESAANASMADNSKLAAESSQTGFFDTAGALFASLGDPATWMRVLYFLVGIAGLVVGAMMLNRNLIGNIVSRASGGIVSSG